MEKKWKVRRHVRNSTPRQHAYGQMKKHQGAMRKHHAEMQKIREAYINSHGGTISHKEAHKHLVNRGVKYRRHHAEHEKAREQVGKHFAVIKGGKRR